MNTATNNEKKKEIVTNSAGSNPIFYTPSSKTLPVWAQACNWQKGGK